MAYKFEEARAAGVSDADIVKHLQGKGEYTYKFDDARAAGVSDADIVNHLMTKPAIPQQDIQDATLVPVSEQPEVPIESTDMFAPATVQIDQLAGIVQPTDVTTTEPISIGLGLEDSTISRPKYMSQAQFEAERATRGEEAQEVATESTFAQEVIDPQTGAVTIVEPTGLEADIPIMTGQLASIRFITPQLEKVLGLQVVNQLSKEAQLILGRNPEGLGMEEAVQLLRGIPKEDQMLSLGYRLGHETLEPLKKAAADSPKTAIALANELKRRQQVLLNQIGPVDTKAAKAKYADMVETIAGDYHNKHDASPILADLNFLEKFYGTTPSKANSVVGQMKTVLDDNPKINLSDALEFRADLNYLISKASRGKEKVKLKSIKNNIDGFIDSVATEDQKLLIDETVGTYSRTMNNRDLLDIIGKSTKDNRAVDWVKLNKKLEEANLNSPEVKTATKIVKEFSERFKNDAKLLNASVVKGTNPDSGGVLGAWGYVVNNLKDVLAIWGDRHDNLKIQGAIIRSLKNSKTSLDFVENIAKDKNVPDEVVKVFGDLPKKSFSDEYDTLPLPTKEDIGKALKSYEEGVTETIAKAAGGGTPPTVPIKGIDFTYKLDRVVEEMPDTASFNTATIEKYLEKKGVSPKEIKASGILDMYKGDYKFKASEWKEDFKGKQQFAETDIGIGAGHTDVSLGGRGADNPTYRETVMTGRRPSNAPRNIRHYGDYEPTGKSLIGWRRTHVDNVNDKPTTVLNEFQSDWAQTERRSRDEVFESNVKGRLTNQQAEQAQVDMNAKLMQLEDELNRMPDLGINLQNGEVITSPKEKELYDEIDRLNTSIDDLGRDTIENIVADFPMSEKKFHQYQIVASLDEAIKNGTNRVAIPIERENELVGSEGVTKFYDSLNKKVLPEIRKKLESQGLMIRIDKEAYGKSSSQKVSNELYNRIEEIQRNFPEDKFPQQWKALEFARYIDNGDNLTVNTRGLDKVDFGANQAQVTKIIDDYNKLPDQGQTLHILEIIEKPNTPVRWDVYSILGAVGLSGLADKLKEGEEQ